VQCADRIASRIELMLPTGTGTSGQPDLMRLAMSALAPASK
jgi:hypothetical protein